MTKYLNAKHGIEISHTDGITQIIGGNGNPAIVGVDASIGSIYLRSDDNGYTYTKIGALSTDWSLTAEIPAIELNTTHRTTVSGNPHSVTKTEVGLSDVPNTDFTSAVAVNTAKISYTDAAVVAANTTDIANVSGTTDNNTSNIATISGTLGTTLNFWNGTFREGYNFFVTSSGTTVTGSLSSANGYGNLIMQFSDGLSLLDVIAPVEILLTAGTEGNPQTNYVYIPQDTKTLTVSTSEWSTVEHIKVAEVALLTASDTATGGPLKNNNWNDHLCGATIKQGHLSHIGSAIRQKVGATWRTGAEGVASVDTGSTPDDVWVTTTEGVVMHMHDHIFPANDTETGSDIHVVNHPTSPYSIITNLNTQLVSANDVSLNSTSFSFVLWGISNKEGEASHLMLNLPTDSYAFVAPDTAVNDAFNYSVYTIPAQFFGVGFLIARFTFTYKNDDWVLHDTEDLRGRIPNSTAGGGGGGGSVTSFLGLIDTPSAYTGQAGLVPTVSVGETGLEFSAAPVTSVFDRTGTITASGGDYTAAQVTNAFDKTTDDADDIDDSTSSNKFTTASGITKLAGIESNAEVNNMSDEYVTDLTDTGDSALHYHATDRDRDNHTGTQTASTISDFDIEVSNNTTVSGKADSGVNSDITSMIGLNNGGIPLQAIANTYGVSWDESADTYSRTGNLAGQATSQTLVDALLPIQTAMRRCILNDNGEVEYYLDATDSIMRESGGYVISGTDGVGTTSKLSVSVLASGTENVGTVLKVSDVGVFTAPESEYVDKYVHNTTDDTYAIITAKDSDDVLSINKDIMDIGETFNIGVLSAPASHYEGHSVKNTTDDTYAMITAKDSDTVLSIDTDIMDSAETFNIGTAILDGTDGQVMVQIPAFYYKYGYSGTTHTWEVSLTPQAGFSLHPAFIKNGTNVAYRYIGAYEGIGYDNSVSDYIDCGTGYSDNWSGTTIDTVNDKLGSVSGKAPMMDERRSEFRAIAANRGIGWRQQDYDLVSAIQLLYLIEYADWNSQAMIGQGRTQLSGGTWVKDSYIGVTGKSNSDGNGTNSVDGNTNDAYMTYRGIENFFGNIWKWVDGININDNVPYVCNTDTNFADNTVTNYTALGITLANANGYQKTLEQQSRGFLPASVGGSSSTYLTDYYYQNTGWRVGLLGGSADVGTSAGVACWYLNDSTSSDNVVFGGRICF